ncbi:hypothetical protein C7974DRAFT_395030 [Boeremia exigua]|uniref:uncharacterized protein n=1 Tax=Boeremia exigua TaxID=749465 RepID=UPI001E8EDE54|nr:uncharacterized protein C7974DRAFT_395030 [Boeremia exigua]KAH6629701.1 hypothetical protein C7974DRAFT_395030 [Boeremia exigua]
MDWQYFAEAAEDEQNAKQQARMELVATIRTRMKEYREALLFECTLACVKSPPSRTFEAVFHASTRFNKDSKEHDPILGGSSSKLYSLNDDLVLLKQPEHNDRLTAFVQRFLPVFLVSEQRARNMAYVPEKSIARFVTILSIVIAVVLLFVAIICLYYISSPTTKLIMVGIFMLLFAGSVGLFTTAKRSEIFAATAAYAAVLVVFVSGDLGSGRPD